MRPPIETPNTCAAPPPIASRTAMASSAICSTVQGSSGTLLLPTPRLSNATTRRWAARPGRIRCHMSAVSRSPWISSSGGSPAPVSSHHSEASRESTIGTRTILRCGRVATVAAVPVDISEILDDLRAEHADLDALATGADLSAPTPAEGWTVGDTVGHLWFFDREATRALTVPDQFIASVQQALTSPVDFMSRTQEEPRALGDRLPDVWRDTRADLLAALSAADPTAKVPWYGPPMSPASFATARLMEYWAHGQDIADGLGVSRTPTARLRHICHLGVRTRGFSYAVRGRQAPAGDVRVAWTAPDGSTWQWGDAAAADKVEGTALDFCLVVTQRRKVQDTALQVTGADAAQWMSLAQAFAGGPTLTDPARAGLPVR